VPILTATPYVKKHNIQNYLLMAAFAITADVSDLCAVHYKLETRKSIRYCKWHQKDTRIFQANIVSISPQKFCVLSQQPAAPTG
jgi:hypothetical protein